jgi:hypothetical protein
MITGDAVTKSAFASAARSAAASLIQALERLGDLQNTYVARGYQPADVDAIVDADIADAKITASQLSQLLTPAWLVTRLLALMGEQTVSGTIQGNVILDKIRSDI